MINNQCRSTTNYNQVFNVIFLRIRSSRFQYHNQYRNCTTPVCCNTLLVHMLQLRFQLGHAREHLISQLVATYFLALKACVNPIISTSFAFRLYFVSTSSPVPITQSPKQLVTEINHLLNDKFGHTRNQSIFK